jgi:hypothetical protein
LCTPVGDSAGVRLSVSDVIPSTRQRQMGFIHASSGKRDLTSRGGTNVAVAEPDINAWRDEVASRVQAHRAKRKRRFDPDSSMSLGFEATTEHPDVFAESVNAAVLDSESLVEDPPPAEQSHTFDVLAEENAEHAYQPPAPPAADIYERMAARAAEAKQVPLDRDADNNLIEFPKAPVSQNLFAEELAEPITAPRILDVPDEPPAPQVVASAPLATVHLDESAELPEWAKDYEDDEEELLLPIQVAPLGSRLLCGVMDAVLVLTAAALFSLIVLSVAKFVPQGKAATAIAILLPIFFWAVYHYVFLVFGGITPGMLMAQLELSSFEGCIPLRRTRTIRAVALVLSCASLGLGFAWAMLDEDSLGWHDRITRTYLRQS